MKVVLREIDNPLSSFIRNEGVLDVPFQRHSPIKYTSSAGDSMDLHLREDSL
jgi:hypothetical protein